MRWPNKNPLTPDSLAADGMQGADDNASGAVPAETTPAAALALRRALVATEDACAGLQCYGFLTDAPAPGVVEAADLLDAARVLLAEVTP